MFRWLMGISFLLGSASEASSLFKNSETLKRIYGFNVPTIAKPLKVAVLDKGFMGFEGQIGQSLPPNTVYVPGPVAPPPDLKVEHGLRMAQIFWDLASDSGAYPNVVAELRLYNVFGFSNFQAAIQDLIADDVDLVLYSEVWEFGGNFDGGGFINAEVQKALDAGVVWINAAGNFAQTTFNSPIASAQDDWLKLPDQNQSLALRCLDNPQKKCQVKVVLSWNDFKDEPEIGTGKDLDLALTDDMLTVLQVSRLRQTNAPQTGPGESKYPRESLTAELSPGLYFIRVKKMSDNFSSQDRLRITVDGEFLSMPSATPEESVLNPADLPGVLTVGAADSPRSGLSAKMKKPDLWALSSIILDDGQEFRGSSNSAAIVAARLALDLVEDSSLTSQDLLNQNVSSTAWRGPRGLSLSVLAFQPTGQGCFKEVFEPNLSEHVLAMIARGAKLVETTHHLRLMVPYDPLTLDRRLRRQTMSDLILVSERGFYTQPRFSPTAPGAVEVFQIPQEAGLCYLPQKQFFHLKTAL